MLHKIIATNFIVGMIILALPVHTASFTPPGSPERPISVLIAHYGEKYGVSKDIMLKVLSCENREFDPELQSRIIKHGVREDSWGLAQIHLPDHPTITKEQATDPEFSVEFLAKNLSEGRGRLWTCYRDLL